MSGDFIVPFYTGTSFAHSSLLIHCLHNRSMSEFKDSPYFSCDDERLVFIIKNCSKRHDLTLGLWIWNLSSIFPPEYFLFWWLPNTSLDKVQALERDWWGSPWSSPISHCSFFSGTSAMSSGHPFVLTTLSTPCFMLPHLPGALSLHFISAWPVQVTTQLHLLFSQSTVHLPLTYHMARGRELLLVSVSTPEGRSKGWRLAPSTGFPRCLAQALSHIICSLHVELKWTVFVLATV